ncbi:MAG: hypothetical protein ACLSS9_08325 [Acutalibacteraceae bacterium]
MAWLSCGYQALPHPCRLGGNFGRAYSSEMEYGASRYTRRSRPAGWGCSGTSMDTVDFVDNYDSSMLADLLPVSFPSILVNTMSASRSAWRAPSAHSTRPEV